jgi:hypothetical protein
MNKVQELAKECGRLSEGCLYTSTSFYEFLKSLRFWNKAILIASIICGAIATWQIVADEKLLAGVAALLAGIIPTISEALKLPHHIEAVERAAAEYKNLQDRFRQAALISSRKSFAEFEADFKALMERMEQVREQGITPPERFFKKGQKKVKNGDYTFDIDLETLADR